MVDGPVVVGVDGSEAAVTAVRWAARTAALRRVPLRLVHAFTTVPPGRFGDPGRSEPYRRRLAEAGEAALGAATRSAHAVDPGLEVRAEVHEGFPVGVLLAASRRATQTVVGSRGLGGVTDLLAGSVAVTLAARGESPVVVVRGRVTDTPDGGSRAPVVVGVDGSPTSEAALGLALEEASLRDAPLLAVHCWLDHPMAPATALRTDGAALAAEEHALLGERLAGWSQKYPDVEIRRLVERRRAAPALLEASDRAQLVVVGSRGRGGAAGLALGSVSHALIHRARCPVLVARPAEEDRDVPDVR